VFTFHVTRNHIKALVYISTGITFFDCFKNEYGEHYEKSNFNKKCNGVGKQVNDCT